MEKFFRILKYGFQNVSRTIVIAQATIWVTTFTLMVVTGIIIFNKLIDNVAEKLKSSVDITISLKKEADEDEILKLKQNLESMPEVKTINYIPREKIYKEAIASGNPIIAQSLEILEGENPYLSQLTIQAKDPKYLASLTTFIEQNYKSLIEKIDYFQNKELIAKITDFISTIKRGGLIITIFLSLIVISVTFNTIRLAIYSLREEIQIMRLVGASNYFIQGPFIVEGIFYGIISAIFSSLLLLLLFKIISERYNFILLEFNFYEEYYKNFLKYFIYQIILGIFLAIISTYLALRRYLKF